MNVVRAITTITNPVAYGSTQKTKWNESLLCHTHTQHKNIKSKINLFPNVVQSLPIVSV